MVDGSRAVCVFRHSVDHIVIITMMATTTTTIGEMTTEEEMTLLRRLRAEWGGVVGRDGCDAGKDDDDDDDDESLWKSVERRRRARVTHDVGTQAETRIGERGTQCDGGETVDAQTQCVDEGFGGLKKESAASDGRAALEKAVAACEETLLMRSAYDPLDDALKNLGTKDSRCVKTMGRGSMPLDERKVFANLDFTAGKIVSRVDFVNWRGANVVAMCCIEAHTAESKMMASGCGIKSTIVVFDLNDAIKELAVLEARSEVQSFRFGASGRVVAGLENGTLALWEMDARANGDKRVTKPVHISKAKHAGVIVHLDWLSSSTVVSVSCDDVMIWNLNEEGFSLLRTMDIGPNVHACTYDPPNDILCCSDQGYAQTVDVCSGDVASKMLPTSGGVVKSISRSSFWSEVVLLTSAWSLCIVNIYTGKVLHASGNSPIDFVAGAFSPTRPGVYYVSKVDGSVDCYDLVRKIDEPVSSVQITSSTLSCMKICNFRDDQHVIAIGDESGSLHVWYPNANLLASSDEELKYMRTFFRL
jgi:hypothetical protein